MSGHALFNLLNKLGKAVPRLCQAFCLFSQRVNTIIQEFDFRFIQTLVLLNLLVKTYHYDTNTFEIVFWRAIAKFLTIIMRCC